MVYTNNQSDGDFLESILQPTISPSNLYDFIRAVGLLKAEVWRLRGMIGGLAERVADQSELLSRRAEVAVA